MEAEKSIKIEDEDNGYEEEMFHQTHPFEIKIEEGDLASLSPKGVCENENVESAIPNGRCENENLNELDTIKVEYDYGFLRNEENFLLETNSLDSDYKSKRNYVDPRIKPCVVLIERCKIPQTVGSTCRPTKKTCKSDICNKPYTEKSNALRHKRTVHENSRPYSCKKYKKSYQEMYMLKRHYNVAHKGIKSYKCQECDKLYTHSSSLLTHKRTIHENVRPYSCDKCGMKFSQRC